MVWTSHGGLRHGTLARRLWSLSCAPAAALLASGTLLLPTAATAATAAAADPELLFRFQDDEIAESSGLATSSNGESLFTHQDAGRPAIVYAVDRSGRTRLSVELPGVENLDWEDIARGTDDGGRPALFVADIGDAWVTLREAGEPARTEFELVRFTEPDVPTDGAARSVVAEDLVRWTLVYEDGRPRNAESLAVQPGTNQVFVVNKVPGPGRPVHLWAAPEELDPDAPNPLRRVARIDVVGASGADFAPAGDRLVVRNDTTAYVWTVSGGDVAAAVAAEPVAVPLPRQRQGEGVTFTPEGDALLLSSEGRGQPVWRVPLPETNAGTPTPTSDPGLGSEPALESPQEPAQAADDARPGWPLVGGAAVGVAVVVALAVARRRR